MRRTPTAIALGATASIALGFFAVVAPPAADAQTPSPRALASTAKSPAGIAAASDANTNRTRVIHWKGYQWRVQDWKGAPTYNGLWSADNVVQNRNGSITLKVTNPTGSNPIASSVESLKRGWGYGTYTSVVEGDFDNMPDSVVFGNLYTYDGTKARGSSANEIDAGEISSWGEIGVQPTLTSTVWHNAAAGSHSPRNEHAYSLPFPRSTRVSTHVLTWKPGSVSFRAYRGWGTRGPLIAQRTLTVDVPVPAKEAVLFNMWVTSALANDQTKTRPYAVTVRDFSFVPLVR